MLISEMNQNLNTEHQNICVSRPRRFGKSMTANMLVAYYSKGCDSKNMFADYKIAQDESFEANLNKYNVLHVNMLDFLNRAQTVDGMIDYLQKRLLWDIRREYGDVDCFDREDLIDVLENIYSQKNRNLSSLSTSGIAYFESIRGMMKHRKNIWISCACG